MPTATDQQPIVKLADSEEFHHALGQRGRTYIDATYPSAVAFQLRLATGLTTDTLRTVAEAVRSIGDNRYPDGSDSVADALTNLADATDRRAPRDWDGVNLTAANHATVRDWVARCADRSALLEPFTKPLTTLVESSDAAVCHARQALALLGDADLLLPGVADALGPVLTRYAGI